jgi:subtilisin-like proprotein convertase family protein
VSRCTLSRAPRRRSVLPLLLSLVLALGIVLGLPVGAAADGPETFRNTAPIGIPPLGTPGSEGQAAPYPSPIVVTGMSGAVTEVTATLNNLTHASVGDIDVLLVAPTDDNLLLLSDLGDPVDPGDPDQLVDASNDTITFDDDADSRLPSQFDLPSGSFLPTNTGAGDTFPGDAPTPSTDTRLADAFTGIDPTGTWQLFIVDDTDGERGDLAGGWSLTITTEEASEATTTTVTSSDASSFTGDSVTFTATVTANGNPVTDGTVQFRDGTTNLGTPVDVNASGVATLNWSNLTEGDHLIRATFGGATGFLLSTSAPLGQRVDNRTSVTNSTYCNTGRIDTPAGTGASTPYPSNIFVSGLAGQITKVTASLRGVTHTESQDLDILLSGPTPTSNLFLLSDVGRNGDAVNNANLVFDDDVQTIVPSPIVNGTYAPTRASDESGDAMPGSAPAATSATELGTFDDQSPNGTWSLWVVDDASGNSGSISGGWCLTITAEVETETELTAEPASSIFDQSVTFSAAVTDSGVPVTVGRVQFSEGAAVLDTVDLTAEGTARFTTDDLAVGSHMITASYLGADNFAESDDDLDYVVSTRPTMTAVTSSDNPSDVDQPVTFTATVTDAGDPVTEGTVQFSIDGTPVGSSVAPNVDGQATYEAMDLAAGTYAVRATYSGTATLGTSFGSLSPDQQVQLLQPIGLLAADPVSAVVNQAVTFTATFAVDGVPAEPGMVDFTDGATTLCADAAVDGNGTATCTAAFATAGPHEIVATFAETATYAEESAELGYVVGLIPTETTLADSASSGVGDLVTFTATTVITGGGPVPTGSVAFTDGTTVLCAGVAVDGTGTATCPTTTLAAGTHSIQATYQANATYAESPSNLVSHRVNLIESTTTVTTTPNPSNIGQIVTITASVVSVRGAGGPVPTGTVTFTIEGEATPRSAVPLDGAGVATITVDSMEPGVTRVDAAYIGDTTYEESAGTTNHGVRPVADAGGPYTVAEGASLALDGSGSTQGVSYGWDLDGDNDFDDVSGPTPTLNWDQLEALGIDDGLAPAVPVTIRLQVRLDDIPSADSDAELTVTNTAPASVLTGGLAATVGVPFTIKVGADDPSSADMAELFTYTVDWGDGSPVVSVVGPADPPVTHTYAAPGDYAASFTATDKDGGTGAPTSVTIRAGDAPIVTPSPTPTTSDPDEYDDYDDADYSDSDDSGLASTGSTVGPETIALGLILLVSGTGMLLASRRRRVGGPRHRG